MHGDDLGRVAGGQGLLDPAASETVAGDAAGGCAGCAPGGAAGLEDGVCFFGGGCGIGGRDRLLFGPGRGGTFLRDGGELGGAGSGLDDVVDGVGGDAAAAPVVKSCASSGL
ncbi:hypothetical protein ACSCB1_02365 [Streptomyces europaeiscabiei]|uniref:hypothetical protein n=1 Tax=Streptomyces europaeiscabiei TaxID=146819 RepID=UPI00131CA74D|nr:hypothetical protein [Streptomyces europaeiscabiei]